MRHDTVGQECSAASKHAAPAEALGTQWVCRGPAGMVALGCFEEHSNGTGDGLWLIVDFRQVAKGRTYRAPERSRHAYLGSKSLNTLRIKLLVVWDSNSG